MPWFSRDQTILSKTLGSFVLEINVQWDEREEFFVLFLVHSDMPTIEQHAPLPFLSGLRCIVSCRIFTTKPLCPSENFEYIGSFLILHLFQGKKSLLLKFECITIFKKYSPSTCLTLIQQGKGIFTLTYMSLDNLHPVQPARLTDFPKTCCLRPNVAVIPIFKTGVSLSQNGVISDYNTFNIHTFVLKDIQLQLQLLHGSLKK